MGVSLRRLGSAWGLYAAAGGVLEMAGGCRRIRLNGRIRWTDDRGSSDSRPDAGVIQI